MIEPKTLERITPAVVRRLREAKASIAEILHVRIEDAAKLIKEQSDVIEAQAKEIERLKAQVKQ